MIAYHNRFELKSAVVAMLAEHQRQDRLGDEPTPDELITEALSAGLISVDIDRGLVYGARWNPVAPRGCKNAGGYIVFTLHFGGYRRQIKAHRTVWIAAHGAIADGFMPDHKNRKRDDNRIENLELVDACGNARNRRSYEGGGNPAAKICREMANDIRARSAIGVSYSELAGQFSISKSRVAQIARGEAWS